MFFYNLVLLSGLLYHRLDITRLFPTSFCFYPETIIYWLALSFNSSIFYSLNRQVCCQEIQVSLIYMSANRCVYSKRITSLIDSYSRIPSSPRHFFPFREPEKQKTFMTAPFKTITTLVIKAVPFQEIFPPFSFSPLRGRQNPPPQHCFLYIIHELNLTILLRSYRVLLVYSAAPSSNK